MEEMMIGPSTGSDKTLSEKIPTIEMTMMRLVITLKVNMEA